MCFFVFESLFTKKKHDKTWQDTRTIFVEVRRYKRPSGNYNEWCISWGWRWWCLWWCRRNFGCDRGRSAVRPSFRIYMDLRIVDIAVAVVIDLNMWDHVGVTTLIDWYSQVVNSCIFFFATRVRYSRVSVLFNLRTAAVPHRVRFFCIVQVWYLNGRHPRLIWHLEVNFGRPISTSSPCHYCKAVRSRWMFVTLWVDMCLGVSTEVAVTKGTRVSLWYHTLSKLPYTARIQ